MNENGVQATMPMMPAGYGGGMGGGMWGQDGWWIIILFLIWGAWGGNGWGGGNGGMSGVVTRQDLCDQFSFQDLKSDARDTLAAVNAGFNTLDTRVCQQSYETAGLVNGLSNTIQGGFNAANITMMQGQNAIQSQLAQCCCDQRAATENLRFTIAQEDCQTRNLIQSTTRDMIDSNNTNTRAILDKLTAQEIEAKNAQIASLNQQLFTAQLAASQGDQTTQIINTLRPFPVAAYQVCNPFTGTYGYQGYGSACGCGC